MSIHQPTAPPPPPYVPLILVYYNTGFIGLIITPTYDNFNTNMYEFQHHGKSRKINMYVDDFLHGTCISGWNMLMYGI